jgi:Superinfection immunity protein
MITSIAMPGPESILIVFFAGIYFIPTIIAVVRRLPNLVAVVLVNVLLGWSFIGWIVALVMSLRPAPRVHIVQNLYIQPAPSPRPGDSTFPPPVPPPAGGG